MRSDERRAGRVRPLRSGVALRAIRERVGITPRDICARIGISKSQLSDIERGIQAVSLRRARQFAAVFEVPLEDVIEALLQERLSEAGFENLEVHVTVRLVGR